MKINTDLGIKLIVTGMLVVFIFLAIAMFTVTDKTEVFVNGDEVKDSLRIGSIASSADTYEFDPGETMKVSMKVTNNLYSDLDFTVKVWEEKSIGSKDVQAYVSEPMTIKQGQSYTFSTNIVVPTVPGIYYYATFSYYAPVGYTNFVAYDDGTNFIVTVLDTSPALGNDTINIDDSSTNGTLNTTKLSKDTAKDTKTLEDDKETVLEKLGIDLEDETTKIAIALTTTALILIVGFFVIQRRMK